MSDLAVRVLRAEVERLDARSNELAEEAEDYSWLAAQVSRDAAEIRRAIALVTAADDPRPLLIGRSNPVTADATVALYDDDGNLAGSSVAP